MARVQSTNRRILLIHMHLAHTVFINDILFEEGVWFVVYSALRIRLAWFVVYSAINVDKVRECHRYIIYIKIVFINNCRFKII